MRAPVKEEDRLAVSIQEAAERLGVSYWTVYRLTQDGTLPAVRIRGVVRIAITDLTAYIDRLRAEQAPQPT